MGKKAILDLTPEQRAAAAERARLLKSPHRQAEQERMRLRLGLTRFAENVKKMREGETAAPSPQEPQQEPQQQRKPRKSGGGRKPMFDERQKTWLQKNFSRDLKKDPLLKKHDAAVPHVKKLAKDKFNIDAGRDTLLDHIIRPVLPA